jgi:hypothetical protein
VVVADAVARHGGMLELILNEIRNEEKQEKEGEK